MDIKKYLSDKSAIRITNGQSGAEVYDINSEFILKYVRRGSIDDSAFDTYSREVKFYRRKTAENCGYIPAVTMAEADGDEIVLIMKKYAHPVRSADESLLRKIMGTLAQIHADSIPDFCEDEKAKSLTDEQIQQYADGWKSVLAEHSGFDETYIDSIARSINDIIAWHDTEKRVLVHGDFHWDNLLLDDGRILVCDWQCVRTGGASGDLSFFMSRSEADGLPVDADMLLRLYSEEAALMGISVDVADIKKHIAAANVITSFVFWHNFLHGNDTARVRGIYDKMTDDSALFD